MNKDLWYKKPRSLEWNPRDDSVGWSAWEKQTKKDYPIQYFFREDVRLYFSIMWRRIKDFKYKIQCFFFPKHQEIRKAIPRTWADISSLIVDVNFLTKPLIPLKNFLAECVNLLLDVTKVSSWGGFLERIPCFAFRVEPVK